MNYDNDSLILPKPWIYKNKWKIWPETVLDFIEISDCDDTINGICLKGKTIEECIEQCIGECAAGYHIQFKDGKSICVPIRTSLYPYLNPVFRLRKKSIYPQLDKVKISTFINTDFFPFPPNIANVVFFRDIIMLKDAVNGNIIETKNSVIKGNDLIYTEPKIHNSNINLLPSHPIEDTTEYIPVRYGKPIQISIPETSIIANVDLFSNLLKWKETSGLELDFKNSSYFRIMPIDDTKVEGDLVTYDDTFSIVYSDNSVVVLNPSYNYLQIENDEFQDILKNKQNIPTFKFISKMNGYYCDRNECKLVPIKDMQTNGPSGSYKGVRVYKNPGCFGICNYSDPLLSSQLQLPYVQNIKMHWMILGMIIITILSIIFIRLIIKNH